MCSSDLIQTLRESCMRENRTCSLSGGRWPARKRATSDPTPMNQPNNEDMSSAEVGEGRAWTKENIVQSDTFPDTVREFACSIGCTVCG